MMSIDPLLEELIETTNELIKYGEFEKAIELLEKNLELYEDQYPIFINLGKAYLKLEDIQTSIQYLNRALEILPENPETLELMGSAYFEAKDWDQALASWKKITEINE